MTPKFKVGDIIADSFNEFRVDAVDLIHNNYRLEVTKVLSLDPRAMSLGYFPIYNFLPVERVAHLVQNPSIPTAWFRDVDAWNFAPIKMEVDKTQALETPKQTPIVTIKDAFQAHMQDSRPKYHGQSAQWHSEGRCPHCGELGRYHLSTAICSKHGAY